MWSLLVCAFLVGYCSAEKIIIIGAGAAGIATAARLLEHNITDFRILESEDRIGGRIHSFHIGNGIVDIGAQYVYGQEGNVLYDLSKKYLKQTNEFDNISLYYGQMRKTTNNLFDEYISIAEDSINSGMNDSLGDAFLARYKAVILKKVKDDPQQLIYSQDLLRTIESLVLTVDGASRWFKISSTTNFELLEGDQTFIWDGLGYETILDLLLKNYPRKTGYNIDKQLSLRKTVTKIILKNDSVKVRCKDGSEYNSEHIVFTPSLGVLKNDHKYMFIPRLGRPKVDAIEDLGYEGAIKVIVEFPNNWWGTNGQFIFVWNENRRKHVINDINFGPKKNGDHWLTWFYSIEVVPKNSNVLIGWIVGPMVPSIEKLTERQMKKGILYALNAFLGKDFNIPEPTRVIHSKWFTNPNFRGVYSYETLVSRKQHPTAQEILAQPITDRHGIPRILFAGEATSTNRFANVDGAIYSGYREADRYWNYLKK